MKRLLGWGAWACLPTLAVLSLLPKDEMVRTGADGRIEHFVAYAGTTALFALAYGERVGVAWLAAAIAGYAALLECGQTFAPGRTPGLGDWAAGAIGAVAAAIAYAAVRRR
ncbi:MAG: VanZ family protein [Alphaproteobacteria bacterium]|nr:VanZ family protein [Alphaproteobacteria bacterium]